MRKIAVLIAMIAFPALLLAQEPDPGTKPEHEKDAVNTESVDRAAYTASVNFTAVDKHALNLPSKYKTIQSLATDLFQPFSTQQEKVRAIFMWITNNISYDCVAYHSKKSTRVSFTYSTQQELAEKKKSIILIMLPVFFKAEKLFAKDMQLCLMPYASRLVFNRK